MLDPLDGTNNYALGIPCFAVSLGIFQLGVPYAGVVHDPNTGFTCWAVRGEGAWAGDHRMVLRGRPLTEASNISARVPLDPTLTPGVVEWLRRHKSRAFGSVALQLGYAALGALDVVLDHRAALSDLAGGASVLLEAGGGPVPFLAGNPVGHAAAVRACRAHLEQAPGRGA